MAKTKAEHIKKAAEGHWIEHAVKKPGSFTRTAKQHGRSVHGEAEADRHKSGKEGKRARLALIFEKMRKHKK
jgi:hypothetical protein